MYRQNVSYCRLKGCVDLDAVKKPQETPWNAYTAWHPTCSRSAFRNSSENPKKSDLQIHNGEMSLEMEIRIYTCLYNSIHMHTREYAYYTCIISYSVKTEARPIANTRPAGSCNIFPLGIWNFGSDLQDGWQIEKLFGALSFSNLTRVSAFSLTPLPGIQASWILFNRFCHIKS